MDNSERKQLEYEEQCFGMSSKLFADSFKNFIQDELEINIGTLINNFKDRIIKEAKNPEKFKFALNTMQKNLKSEYKKNLDELFPEIEAHIARAMKIPGNVLLKEDLDVRNGIDGNINDIKGKIENLQGTYKSLLYLKQQMLEEIEEADAAIFFMENIISEKKMNLDVLPLHEISALSVANNELFNKA